MLQGALTDAEAAPVQNAGHTRVLAARARAIIERRYARPNCTTAGIASRLGVPSSTLCRIYRAIHGRTIGAEIRQRRIALACRLICDRPDRLLKEVAAEAGFRHASYRTFLNAFRQQTGMTPREYRQVVRASRRHAETEHRARAAG